MKEIELRDKLISDVLITVNNNINNVIHNLDGTETFSSVLLLIKNAFKPLIKTELKVNNYNDLAKRVKNEYKGIDINILYGKDDVKLINSLSKANLSIMKSIRNEYESQISALIFSSQLSQVDSSTMAEQVAALIIPNEKIVGRALKGVLQTEVETFVMETDATIMLKKGNDAGIEQYQYIGSLIKDSRPWCVNHLNKILTLSEIQDWNKSNWKGKKAGNPFTARGGWRCRHHFAPIVS